MPGKVPDFTSSLKGHVETGQPVQFGCVYCLSQGLVAPAEHHIAYMWQGTSMCASHFESHVMKAGQQ